MKGFRITVCMNVPPGTVHLKPKLKKHIIWMVIFSVLNVLLCIRLLQIITVTHCTGVVLFNRLELNFEETNRKYHAELAKASQWTKLASLTSLAWRGNTRTRASTRSPRGRRYKTEAPGSHKSLRKEDLVCEEREESGEHPGKQGRGSDRDRSFPRGGLTG